MSCAPAPGPERFDYGDGTPFPIGQQTACRRCGNNQDIGFRCTHYRANENPPFNNYYADASESSGGLRCSAATPPERVSTCYRGDHWLYEFDCFECRARWRGWIALHKGQVFSGGMHPTLQPVKIREAAIADLAESIQQQAEEIAAWVNEDQREGQ